MTLATVDGFITRRSPQPLSPPLKPASPPLRITVDIDTPNVPLYHATTQASVLFLLTLLELSPPHLRRYIDPPQPLPPVFETEGTPMDAESLLFLCKDVLATLCPPLLDTAGWDELVQKVLLLRDEDAGSDSDGDIPIFQQDWEKQWEYSDEEEESSEDVDHVALEGRGSPGFGSRHWEAYGLRDGEVIPDEFDDVVKDGDGDPATRKEWHTALDSIGCMDLVSRACEMLAEWVEENGEPGTISPSFADVKSSLEVHHSSASNHRLASLNCTGVHRLRRLPAGSKAIDSAFSLWAIQYVEPDFDLPDLPPYPTAPLLVSDWTWEDERPVSRGRKRA